MSSPPSSSNTSTAFDQLAPEVRRWIWDKGWHSLRDIQERAIHTILNNDNDLVIAAPTAGGKTEAAFLPLISAVLNGPKKRGFDILYVAPLRALINDQYDRLEDIAQRTDIPRYPWHGDIGQGIKARARRNANGILLITPESLEAIFVLRGLEVRRLFEDTRTVIIDELHDFLDSERGIHLLSLMSRLETALGHRVRRIGLSATLSNMRLVKEYLRPDAPDAVEILESKADSRDLRAQLRVYMSGPDEKKTDAARSAVTNHIFDNLRGKTNLFFAGSRTNVEWYADALRRMSEDARVPPEFFPHHGNLSRGHRIHLEERLKSNVPTTAICTSTLELGIDIGTVDCVAQLHAPYTVAALRQRLGRSGRREGQPAVLRLYNIEEDFIAQSNPISFLRLKLIQSIAMVELLLTKWSEPPAPHALHLSTLVHQVLSVIAERGGANIKEIYNTLCKEGPFRSVDTSTFVRLLRQLGHQDVRLIEQSADSTLLLGEMGEKLVEHYSFYPVFQTPEEYRIVSGSRAIGTLPIVNVLLTGMSITLAGARWHVTNIDRQNKVIEVVPSKVGRPPVFTDEDGIIHDHVAEKMREVLSGQAMPRYLDSNARKLLEEARHEFRRLELHQRRISPTGPRSCLVATWCGTIKTKTLELYLMGMGYEVMAYTGLIEVHDVSDPKDIEQALRHLHESGDLPQRFLNGMEKMETEKYHKYLGPELLFEDLASSRLAVDSLPTMARNILAAEEDEHSTEEHPG